MKKNFKIGIGIFFVFFALGIFGIFLVRSVYYAPTDEVILPAAIESKITKRAPTALLPGIPLFVRHLTIPALSINAKIQDVGITRKGNMSTPNNFFDVGLYKYGPLPGDIGSSVIAGHVDNGLGLKAVFGNLKDIQVGDDIYVEIKKGVKVHFIVKTTTVFDYNAPSQTVFDQSDGSYLKLITCSGTWMPELRTHDKRLVVTAVKS